MPRRGSTRDLGALALAAGSAASGLLAYLYIGIGTREYGAAEFSGVAQLWTIWFVTASVLTFPIQHWVIQRLRTDGHGGAVAAALPRLTLVAAGLALAIAVVTGALGEDLYDSTALVYPLCAGAITLGAAAMGLLRGGLAGRDRFVATGTAIGTENVVRLVFGLVVIAVGAGVGAYGATIVTGVLVIAAWPGAVRFSGPTPDDVNPLAFLGNVGGGTVIAQFVLTGGTVVLGLTGGTGAEVTSLFAALALFRAPYIVALGVAIRVTAHLTDLINGDRWDDLHRLRHRLTAGGVGLAALGAAGAAVLGPPILTLVFGDEIDLTGAETAALAAGSLLALATLGLSLVQMTTGSGRHILQAWLAAVAVGAVVVAVAPLDPLPAVVAAFLVTEAVAFALMAVLRPGPTGATP